MAKRRRTVLRWGDAVDSLTEEQVRQAMNTIASANVFEKDGVAYYETPQSASYVERTVSDIFNDGANSESASADKQD